MPWRSPLSSGIPFQRGSLRPMFPGGGSPIPFRGCSLLHEQAKSANTIATDPHLAHIHNRCILHLCRFYSSTPLANGDVPPRKNQAWLDFRRKSTGDFARVTCRQQLLTCVGRDNAIVVKPQ